MKIEEIEPPQMIELIKLRFANEKKPGTLKTVLIYKTVFNKSEMGYIMFTLYTIEHEPENAIIYLTKVYPNEFFYLQSIGVTF
jgi:hypothetical protein